jgi:hypothetical protein
VPGPYSQSGSVPAEPVSRVYSRADAHESGRGRQGVAASDGRVRIGVGYRLARLPQLRGLPDLRARMAAVKRAAPHIWRYSAAPGTVCR